MGKFRDMALAATKQQAMSPINKRLEKMRADFNKILEQSEEENFDLSENSKKIEAMAFDGFLDLVEMRSKLKQSA